MSKTVPLDGNSAARSLYYYVTCGLLGRCRIQVVQASSTDGAGCTRCLQAIKCSVRQYHIQVVQGVHQVFPSFQVFR